MLRTLESPERNCYSHTLRECSCRFLPTPLPSMVCARALCGPTMWPQPGWRRTRFNSAYPGENRYPGQGRKESILPCLPALEASIGTTSPSASKEMVQLWQCPQMSKLLMWPARHGGLQKCSACACSQVRTIQSSLV